MFSYYYTEFQPGLRQAEVEWGLAGGALADAAVTVGRPSVRERMAAALVALAARLAPTGGVTTLPSRATRLTAWR